MGHHTWPHVTSLTSTCFYLVVLIKNVKELKNIFLNLTKDYILLMKLEKCHYIKAKTKSSVLKQPITCLKVMQMSYHTVHFFR